MPLRRRSEAYFGRSRDSESRVCCPYWGVEGKAVADDIITILLVGNQPDIRRGLRMRLGLEPDIRVVGEAGDSAAALAMAEDLAPKVVLVDAEMAGHDGIGAAAELARRAPCSRVVVLTLRDDAAARAACAGACALVAKHEIEKLMAAVRGEAAAGAAP